MTVSKACKELIIVQPFYGLFLLNLSKKFTKDIPTLAVAPNGIIERYEWFAMTNQYIPIEMHKDSAKVRTRNWTWNR